MSQSQMPSDDLPEGYLEAGREYYISLRKLGFSPILAIWAWDKEVEEWVLLISTDLIDAVGPFEIMKVLSKAYQKAVTPRTISPFIVRLDTPKNFSIQQIINYLNGGGPRVASIEVRSPEGVLKSSELYPEPGFGSTFTTPTLVVKPIWNYVAGLSRQTTDNPFKAFKSFAKSVDRLAA